MSLITPALPKGSLILVTGANGYIGSHVVDQLLKLGYNVRGTIRNEKPWIEILFSKRCREHGSSAGVFEAVVIEDIAKQGAFNHVIEGVSGIVHVVSITQSLYSCFLIMYKAADLSFDTNAEKVISFAVAANINILSVAAANDTIKRVVLTSSSTACNIAKPFEPTVVITHDTWNDEITYLIKTMQTNMPDTIKGYLIYAASKTGIQGLNLKIISELY
jgi:nucleoside-diphosphate-sugar epimerase